MFAEVSHTIVAIKLEACWCSCGQRLGRGNSAKVWSEEFEDRSNKRPLEGRSLAK